MGPVKKRNPLLEASELYGDRLAWKEDMSRTAPERLPERLVPVEQDYDSLRALVC